MRDLHRLGYAQQLYRQMGGFSNFAISFSIISILTGAIQLFGYGLQFGGPAINTYGWPLVSVFVLCVAEDSARCRQQCPNSGSIFIFRGEAALHPDLVVNFRAMRGPCLKKPSD